ncbi:plasmid mobilization relaxosome protein MobC [Parahaliea sp. F7430]|uniref:Plasmid mobilization relaxosome protein MobC n=1 Tax=Sediminihaliea albiluteola TaxID=2758564 RepID=A0A7W2YKC7_9GAMM|nr:plasmid mobilization relaxosome protein MobC [Sediminihaliea albiluteola]MBA6414035.1 plasmid mobilization relaxosome protein MobC [Sediminihaliea albiluteola]
MPREAKIGAPRGSHVYTLRLPADLREQWMSYCERNDKKAAATLRALMRYLIQDDLPTEVQNWVAKQVEGKPDSGPKERLEVRFTPTEYQGITTRAEAEGCSPQRWVINCVRAGLTHEPQFTMETTKALWESSYQLRAIGRNLNQITKRINKGLVNTVETEQLENLAEFIYLHTDKVAAVQDASISRWKINTNNQIKPQISIEL